ncbi:MAG: hypothetical protein M3335_05655 [Actinomycetota bacterium]|nr:hypothetical protein [Actinomycetota bacterium]
MARLVRPVAGSAKTVYVDRKGKRGNAVTLSSRAGEAVEVVDNPAVADEVVTVYVGSSKVSKADAKRLAKAAIEEQERQRRGQREKGAIDRIVAGLEASSPKPVEDQRGDGLRFRNALILAGLMWLGLAVYLTGEEGAGMGFVALLLGVAMVPACAMVFKFMDLFLPEGLVGLAAFGLMGLTWAAALGIVDIEKQASRRAAVGASGSAAGGAVDSTAAAAGGGAAEMGRSPATNEPEDWASSADAYTVIVASKPNRGQSAAFAARLPGWVKPAGVLRSDSYTTLLPGYWVAFGGRFSSVEDALAAAERLRGAGFAGAFAELISRKPQDPTGTITAASVGSLRVGMAMDEVRRYVTRPDSEKTISFGGSPAPEVDWSWHFDDGDLILQFDRQTGRLTRFEVTTDAVETSSGLTVGDSFAPIRQRYGGQLRASPLGEGGWVLSEGDPGSYPALVFSLRGGEIAAMAGGLPRPAGE